MMYDELIKAPPNVVLQLMRPYHAETANIERDSNSVGKFIPKADSKLMMTPWRFSSTLAVGSW